MRYAREALIAVGSAAAGAGASFLFFRSKFRAEADAEIESIKQSFKNMEGKLTIANNPVAVADSVASEFEEIIERNRYTPIRATPAEPVKVSAFDTAPIFEPENRGPETPYIIDITEATHDDEGYDLICLEYYDQDGTVVGEDDEPIPDVDRVLGHKNLARMGDDDVFETSRDRDMLYIRNDRTGFNYEVTRKPGAWTHEMLQRAAERDEDNELRHGGRF